MNDRPFVSMVMIAGAGEAENVEPCFASWWNDVDEAVLVFTGPEEDGTIEAAEAFATAKGERDKLVIDRYAWTGDFGAARRYAESLATGEWRSWSDLDDTVHGLDKLRAAAKDAGPEVSAFFCDYDYFTNEAGVVVWQLRRERLVRAGAAEWVGRVHEYQHIQRGGIVIVDHDLAHWTHRKVATGASSERNLSLLKTWLDDEPENGRVLSYIALELAGAGKIAESIPYFERYKAVAKREAPEARAQVARHHAQALASLGRNEEAQTVAVQALAEVPSWPDTYLTLAEQAHNRQEWASSIDFATNVVRKGQPNTALIINPLDYTARPRVLIATALANLGQLNEAIQAGRQANEMSPGFMDIDKMVAEWEARKAREDMAAQWENSARMLADLDELDKAAVILHTAPSHLADHPRIIAARVSIDRMLDEPYQVRTIGESPAGAYLVKELQAQRALHAQRLTVEEEREVEPMTILDLGGAAIDYLRDQLPDDCFKLKTSVVEDDDRPDAVIVSADLDNQCDPGERIEQLARGWVQPGGRLYVVTPEGRVNGKRTPGRRRAWRSVDIAALLRQHGTLKSFGVADDGMICGSITPCSKREHIAVWTGRAIGPWHPTDITTKGLGGSETAAWRIAENLAELGYCVTLYGQFTEQGCVKDVILRDWITFDPLERRKAVIAFRDAQMFDLPNINADTKILWLEDVAGAEGLTPARASNLDVVATVSEWHRENVLSVHDWIDPRKVHAHRNGVNLAFFDGEPVEREKRVVYSSSPDRGLDIVLACWPDIVARVPDATLAHSYGPWYDLVAQVSPEIAAHRKGFTDRSDYQGVEATGNLGQQKLALLMRASMVWVAPSYFSVEKCKFTETSCISAMEAQAAGLRIVGSRWGALQETVKTGVLLDGDPADPDGEWRKRFVGEVVEALTNPDVQAQAQAEGPAAVADMGWRGVAEGLMREWNHDPRAQPLVMA